MTTVYIYRNEIWQVHYTYPNQLAAENAAAQLQALGFLTYIGV